MTRGRTGALVAGLALGVFVLGHDAGAVLTKDQQKCVNALNKDFAKVAQTRGKEIQGCIKNIAKGKAGGTVADCAAADAKGKIAKAEQKALDDEAKKCDGNDKNGDPKHPGVLATDAANNNQVAAQKELAMIGIIFGSDTGPITEADSKDGSKCQQAIAKDLQKCQDAKLKEFVKCKKNALKEGKEPVTSGADEPAELEVCVLDDPKGKIAKTCDDPAKPDKIRKDLDKKCVGKSQDLCTLFPQCCPPCTGSDIECVHDCLEFPVECEVCKAVNAADGLDANCDLLDNGVEDGSCGGGGGPIGQHKCVLDPNSLMIVDFGISNLPVVPTGSVDIDCGAQDPGTGKAECSCTVQDLDPLDLQPIGFVCLTPFPGCAPGEIDCDGGNALDVDLDSNHSIGICTSNADCEAQCAAFCPPGSTPFDPGCEGYCEGGINDELPCLDDSECPGGSCPGPNGGHVADNNCGCSCVTVGGAPAPAGGLMCNLGMDIVVEDALPCGDGDVNVAVGATCMPITTQSSTGIIHNANLLGGDLGGQTLVGVPGDCQALASSVTSGMSLVGQVNFYDSDPLGDLNVLLTLNCQ